MDRANVVQSLLNLFPDPHYLELGVDGGQTFHAVQAAIKVAVDPAFKFPVPLNTAESTTLYHQVTSDTFFAVSDPVTTRFDVVFVDGLHTFEQVLRDTLNAMGLLKPFGVLVIDDVTPNSYHAALPDLAEAFQVRDYVRTWHPELLNDATWMGDVYKLAFFIKSFAQQFSMATVAENHGQMILWRAPREADQLGGDTFLDVALTDFKATVLRRDVFNLTPFPAIMDQIRNRPGFVPKG